LGEGKLKTGKTVLDEGAQKVEEHERFMAAAQEEERMRCHKSKKASESLT